MDNLTGRNVMFDNADEQYRLITINSFTDIFIANIWKTKLESEGLVCYLYDENIGSMNFQYSFAINGIKLKILKSDYNKALKILNDADDVGEDIDDYSCIKCESKNIEYFHYRRGIINAFGIFFLGFPIIFPLQGYKCNDCGYKIQKNNCILVQFIYLVVIFYILLVRFIA
jgi:DNA-directed RNA polymerase subunit RPC12/RpoP